MQSPQGNADRLPVAHLASGNDVIQEQATVERLTRRLRAVLFVDVVESVRLIQKDPDRTVARWRDFVAAVTRDDLPAARGRMVKHLGDGMLVEFESVLDAVECALAMQARIERGNVDVDADRQIHLRMGIHVADVLADDVDLYGDGVNLAARLMVLGGPQEIVISAAVRDQLTDGLGLTIEDLGERQLKGMERPVRAFRAWPLGPMPSRAAERLRHAGDRPSIAVLPLRNLSRDPAHDFLGDLLAEDVIGHLSRLTDLFVISRLSTTPFRDRLYEPRNVAEVLGVRYVLSGSLLAAGNQLQVIAELTEAEVGRVIWSERFRGSMADIFELQEALARDIAKRVVPYVRRLELQRARSKHPENLTAYERLLRAIDHLHRTSREDLDQARVLLEAAVASDPSYATAYAWLARWHVLRIGQGWSPDRARDIADANRHADAALARDDTDPWALAVHGLVSRVREQGSGAGDLQFRPGARDQSERGIRMGLEHCRLRMAWPRRRGGCPLAPGDRALAARSAHVRVHVAGGHRACGGRTIRQGDRLVPAIAAREPDVPGHAPAARDRARAVGPHR